MHTNEQMNTIIDAMYSRQTTVNSANLVSYPLLYNHVPMSVSSSSPYNSVPMSVSSSSPYNSVPMSVSSSSPYNSVPMSVLL
jgi:hypothetical protein